MSAWWLPAAWGRTGACASGSRLSCGRSGAELYFPRTEFCTDNGAMIALAGCMRLAAGTRCGLGMSARANWELTAIGD